MPSLSVEDSRDGGRNERKIFYGGLEDYEIQAAEKERERGHRGDERRFLV